MDNLRWRGDVMASALILQDHTVINQRTHCTFSFYEIVVATEALSLLFINFVKVLLCHLNTDTL